MCKIENSQIFKSVSRCVRQTNILPSWLLVKLLAQSINKAISSYKRNCLKLITFFVTSESGTTLSTPPLHVACPRVSPGVFFYAQFCALPHWFHCRCYRCISRLFSPVDAVPLQLVLPRTYFVVRYIRSSLRYSTVPL